MRQRTHRQMAAYGAPQDEVERAKSMFDPNALTLGFARRFATYKRPNLLLHDPERLARILTNQQRPVQLVLAGKAHPADQAGKDMIREWIQFVRRSDIRQHAVFLVDYDMLLAARMVQGVDVWINTPRRPWEASGTSGMKILTSGGLNLSELDGWWAEAYESEVGWALGDGKEHGDDPAWDTVEAGQLYDILEHERDSAFLRSRCSRTAAQMDRNDARKHGAPDAAVFRQPRRSRVHREILSAGRASVTTSARPRRARSRSKSVRGMTRSRSIGPSSPSARPNARLSATFITSACRSTSTTSTTTAVRVELYAQSRNGELPRFNR